MLRWKVDYYDTTSERKPVQEFIEKLEDKPRSRVSFASWFYEKDTKNS